MKFNIFNRIKNVFKKTQYALPTNLSGPAKEIIAIIDDEIAKSAEFGLEILEEHQLKEKHVILLVIGGLANIGGSNSLTFDVAMQFFSGAILRILEDESQYYFDKLKKEGRTANMYQVHLHSVAGRVLNTIYDKKLTQRHYIYLGG